MTEFNSNLNSLFKNFQRLNNGNLSQKEKADLDNEKNDLLKNKNLFDVNGDGKFNQDDVDMFVKGDVNGDGTYTEEELNFIATYKSNMKNKMIENKADFTLDGKTYKSGILKYTIIDNNKDTYPNAVGNKIKFSDKKSISLADGETAIINKDGTVSITKSNNGKIESFKRYYKGGTLQYSRINNYKNEKENFPCLENNKIKFQDKEIALNNGESAVIDSNGCVKITTQDGKN